MPSFRYLFSESIWNVKEFLKNPRKIHAVFPAITIFAFWRIIFEYRKVMDYVPDENSLPIALFSIMTMAIAFIVCYVGSTVIKRTKPRFWFGKYLLTIGIAVSPIAIFFLVALERSYAESAIAFFRLVLLVGVTESIAGFLISQVQKRTQELEGHQKSLIIAEENFRSLVSSHLHDNLQTRLVAIGIQLNQIRGSVDDSNSANLLSVIDEIEKIRSNEVRDFGKEITPNFEIDDLSASLRRLFARYQDVISCHLYNFDALGPSRQTKHDYSLGIYRIVEQALLNSLAHGKASKFDAYINDSSEGIGLRLVNNGTLYEAHSSPSGHGFAVIDAWVSELDGSWDISNNDDQVVIEIKLNSIFSHM